MMATKSFYVGRTTIVLLARRVRYLWPENWVPLLPALCVWWHAAGSRVPLEFGIGLAWLWWKVGIVVGRHRCEQ